MLGRPLRASVRAGRPSRAAASASSCSAASPATACGSSSRRRRAVVPEARAAHQRLHVAGRDMDERDVGIGGDGVDAILPPALDDPHDRAHQTTCRANHRPAVAATRIAGTLLSPSTVNARMSVGSSCACITRRHSSVASEPT